MSVEKVLRFYDDQNDEDLTLSIERADDRVGYLLKVVHHSTDGKKYSIDLSAEELDELRDFIDEVL